MSLAIEANLKIPGLTVRTSGQPDTVINNTLVRFLKTTSLPSMPTVGSLIDVTVEPAIVLSCTVTRVEWSDERGMFVVSCTYANRRLPVEQYQALIADPLWRRNELPM